MISKRKFLIYKYVWVQKTQQLQKKSMVPMVLYNDIIIIEIHWLWFITIEFPIPAHYYVFNTANVMVFTK